MLTQKKKFLEEQDKEQGEEIWLKEKQALGHHASFKEYVSC